MDHVFLCFHFTCRPDFYTIYVEEPDSAGHESGPVSATVSLFEQMWSHLALTRKIKYYLIPTE